MKFLKLLLVLLLTVSLTPITQANALCRIYDGASALHARLAGQGAVLGNKMIDLIEKSLKINGHPRFNDRPDLTPEMAAFEDVTESLGAADSIAPGHMGDRTAEAWAEVALSDDVIDTPDVSYQDQGAGLGYIARDSGLDDVKVGELLDKVHTVCSPNTPIFRDMGVTAAHVLDSVRELRSKNVDLPASYWGGGALSSTEAGNVSGSSAELLIMANSSRANKRISGVEIDKTDPQYEGTKIDYFEDDNRMVQVGLTLDTIKDKWQGGGTDKKIAFASALAKARFLQPDRKHIFKYLDKNGRLPEQNALDELNAYIANQANWLTFENFEPVSALP